MLTTPATGGPSSICSPARKRDILIIGCRLGKRTDNMNNHDDMIVMLMIFVPGWRAWDANIGMLPIIASRQVYEDSANQTRIYLKKINFAMFVCITQPERPWRVSEAAQSHWKNRIWFIWKIIKLIGIKLILMSRSLALETRWNSEQTYSRWYQSWSPPPFPPPPPPPPPSTEPPQFSPHQPHQLSSSRQSTLKRALIHWIKMPNLALPIHGLRVYRHISIKALTARERY